ncbi:transcription repressor OFP14-like [Neltuma alba]|uniref:transcription repressor OFP14-like n=1 Tax=Neltuma alba TaxID=207710 RepID=UPI0010A3F79E|nr:transcription repressor OFP14-like [Prosopis alba]
MSFSVYIKPHSTNNAESSSSEPRQACQVPSIMPRKLQRSLHGYISKLRRNPNPQINFSSSKSWIFSACKHPKTLSIDVDHRRNDAQAQNDDDAASLSDVDRFLFENFKSLYLREDDEETERNAESEQEIVEATQPKLDPILFDSPRLDLGLPPDLRGSNRFFVTPGFSGSLVEDAAARLSMATTCDDEAGSSSSSTTTLNDYPNLSNDDRERQAVETIPRDFIAVLMYSPKPYDDFRRSMQDMVEARLNNHERVDWDFMEELLSCYLNLNEKKSHKFILSAFVDVIAGMRRRSETVPATLPRSVRTVRIGRASRRR